MSFSTFEITELTEEAENDFKVEVRTGEALLGFLVSERELRGMGEAMTEAAAGDMESWDQEAIQE